MELRGLPLRFWLVSLIDRIGSGQSKLIASERHFGSAVGATTVTPICAALLSAAQRLITHILRLKYRKTIKLAPQVVGCKDRRAASLGIGAWKGIVQRRWNEPRKSTPSLKSMQYLKLHSSNTPIDRYIQKCARGWQLALSYRNWFASAALKLEMTNLKSRSENCRTYDVHLFSYFPDCEMGSSRHCTWKV